MSLQQGSHCFLGEQVHGGNGRRGCICRVVSPVLTEWQEHFFHYVKTDLAVKKELCTTSESKKSYEVKSITILKESNHSFFSFTLAVVLSTIARFLKCVRSSAGTGDATWQGNHVCTCMAIHNTPRLHVFGNKSEYAMIVQRNVFALVSTWIDTWKNVRMYTLQPAAWDTCILVYLVNINASGCRVDL